MWKRPRVSRGISQRFRVFTGTAHSELHSRPSVCRHVLIAGHVAHQSSTRSKLVAPSGGERWRNGQAARPRSWPVTCPQPAGNHRQTRTAGSGPGAGSAWWRWAPPLAKGTSAMCCDRAVTGPGRRTVSGLGACAVGVSMTRLAGPVRCFPACSLVEWSWAFCPCVVGPMRRPAGV